MESAGKTLFLWIQNYHQWLERRKFSLMYRSNIRLLKRELPVSKKVYYSSKEPESNNPTYQHSIKVGCPYCIGRGRKKNFKNLFKLYMHFRIHHSDESRHKNIVVTLADLIIQGVLI